MHKIIRISAIVAICLMGLSMLIILISIPFQDIILSHIFDIPEPMGNVYYEYFPIFPTVQFISCCLSLGLIVALLFVCRSQNNGIGLEIFIFICLLVLIPSVTNILDLAFTSVMVREMGSYYINASTLVKTYTSYCMVFAKWAYAVAYAVCGMSVVSKLMRKNAGQYIPEIL